MPEVSAGGEFEVGAMLWRLGVLLVISGLSVGFVWAARQFVRRQQRQVVQTTQFRTAAPVSAVRILAFHTVDCRQCFTVQHPALERLQAARAGKVQVIDIDAIAEPEIARQYRVMTVPTTVVLDHTGHAQAVNYGFANTHLLLQQVDLILAADAEEPMTLAARQ